MALSDHNNETYERLDYWEERYKDEDNFEWCCKTEMFYNILTELLPASSEILMLGCGNSTMSADLYQLGYKNITNIDYSATVIEKMERKYEALNNMSWKVMDMFNLDFPEGGFDCVVEKATFEVLFVKERDPWNVSEDTKEQFVKVLHQMRRIARAPAELYGSTSGSNAELAGAKSTTDFQDITGKNVRRNVKTGMSLETKSRSHGLLPVHASGFNGA